MLSYWRNAVPRNLATGEIVMARCRSMKSCTEGSKMLLQWLDVIPRYLAKQKD